MTPNPGFHDPSAKSKSLATTQITLASGALLTVETDGSFTYDPNGAFDSLGGGVSANEAFSYTLSNGQTSDEGTVTITLTNINEGVVDVAIDNTVVSENSTFVGTVTGTDLDGDELQFIIWPGTGGADKALFEIDLNTGVLSFITPPNFEEPLDADGDNVYEVGIFARDSPNVYFPFAIEYFSITVTEVIEETGEFRTQYGMAADGSDDAADWSGNGVPNIHYFAFGLGDPNETDIDRSLLPTVTSSSDGTAVIVTFVRAKLSTLNYEVFRSKDLSTWTVEGDLPVEEQSTESDPTDLGNGYERVEKTFPIEGNDTSCFYRIGIST